MLPHGLRKQLTRVLAVIFLMTTSLTFAGATASPTEALANDKTLDILSLTDSYGSGIGIAPTSFHYDAFNEGRKCEKGATSQVRLTQQSLQRKGWNVKVDDRISCMSYVIDNLNKFINTLPGQAAINGADVIFIRIGGNDAGFVPKIGCTIVTDVPACLANIDNPVWSSLRSIGEMHQSFVRSVARFAKPGALIVVDNYPLLMGDGRNNWDATNPVCIALNKFVFTDNELATFKAQTLGMNQHIANTVSAVNGTNGVRVKLMDVAYRYAGHEICGSGVDWINGFDAHPHLFHPNYTAYNTEAAVLEQIIGSVFNKSDFGGEAPTGPTPEPAPTPAPVYPPRPANPSNGYTYSNAPFACGASSPFASTYDVYGSFRHGYAIDLPLTRGTDVVSPASGTVTVKSNPGGYGNYIDLVDSAGVTHRFAHLQDGSMIASGRSVIQGEYIAKVGTTGASTGPHLHYEQRRNGSQISIVLNGPAFQWGARYTSGGDRQTLHAIVSDNCEPIIRVGSLRNNGCLYTKDAKLTGPWTKQACNVADFELDGDRIAILKDDDRFFVKEGPQTAPWDHLSSNVIDFDLEGDRVAIVKVTNGNRLGYVKEGPLNATWTKVSTDSIEIQLEGNLIAVLRPNGELHVKGPNINSPWILETRSAKEFILTGTRLIVATNNKLIAKPNALGSQWVTLSGYRPSILRAEGDRIVIVVGRKVWAKQGALNATWILVTGGDIDDVSLTSDVIILTRNGNSVQMKSPLFTGAWTILSRTDAVMTVAEGNAFGFVTASGVFYAKNPPVANSWLKMQSGVIKVQIVTMPR